MKSLVPDNERPRGADTLVALIVSAISSGVLIFTIVLYAHYFHLHTYPNHILVGVVLGSAFLVSLSIFWNVFVFPEDEMRFSESHCMWAGFVHELLSVSLLWGVFVNWLCLAASVQKWRRLAITRVFGVLFAAGMCLLGGTTAACVALGADTIRQYHQAWCHGGEAWYVALTRFLPICLSWGAMLLAMVRPLTSERVNADQKNLLTRRVVGHTIWSVMLVYASLGTLFKHSHFAKMEQAALEPMASIVLALFFLISERMLTFRALGLPPGADPPYGFTNAMHYIPDKLSYDDTASLLRDTTIHHSIVKA